MLRFRIYFRKAFSRISERFLQEGFGFIALDQEKVCTEDEYEQMKIAFFERDYGYISVPVSNKTEGGYNDSISG